MICSPNDQQIQVEAQHLHLLPERAVFWPDRQMVIITDLHLGKAAVSRGGQDDTGAETFREDLERLGDLIHRTAARHLLILGDLLHSRAPGREEAMVAFAAWRTANPVPDITLIRGNHDRLNGDPPAAWDVRCVDEPFPLGPFSCRHYPRPTETEYVLAGHLHPSVVLAGPRRRRLKYPCFWFSEQMALLPAFGSITRTSVVRPQSGDRVFVVSDDAVLSVRS